MSPVGLTRGVAFLAATQHRGGSWTDFLLAPGPSDAWVTAYVGTALALVARSDLVDAGAAAQAGAAADAAAHWLLRATSDGTWGWTQAVRPDADSTAWAVRLLAIRGLPVPAQALEFLDTHDAPAGYRTYRNPQVSGTWAQPSPEVTAAVLLAKRAARHLTRPAMAQRWCELVLPARQPDGSWRSMWWQGSAYPTAVVRAAWAEAGRPPLEAETRSDAPDPALSVGPAALADAGPVGGSAWEVATRLWASAGAAGATGSPDAGAVAGAVADLLALCRADGGWPGGATLRVPAQRGVRAGSSARDARGIFTTATALQALLSAGAATLAPARPSAGPAMSQVPLRPAAVGRVRGDEPTARRPYDDLVGAMAEAAGVDPARVALPAFRALTRESLARHGVWPAPQLSNLAGGTPLEFSVGGAPALRLTTEVGDPLLAPHDRVRTGLRAVHRTASLLGMADAWRAVGPAVDALTDQHLPAPDGCRFWLWAGLDVTPAGRAVLKAYLSLLAEDVPGWRQREGAFLTACGVAPDAPARAVLDRLAEVGWGHEVGVGMGAGGAWGIKVYYELDGYRPALVREVLGRCGLDTDLAGVAPEVPGVLRGSLAAKRRAGIALRIDQRTGRVTEVTVAAAFPTPLVGRDELAARVRDWLGPAGGPHEAALQALGPSWDTGGVPEQARMHSLFTRSRSASGDEVKVYLRPWLG